MLPSPDSSQSKQTTDTIVERIGSLTKYAPRQLTLGENPLIFSPTDIDDWYRLEEAHYIDEERHIALFFGNSHGFIFPMLRMAKQRGLISFPLDTVLNIDAHADVANYTSLTTIHEASWQRYGADNQLWKNSYNWQPDTSTNLRPKRSTNAITTEGVEHITNIIDVLSIDMDFFNGLLLDSTDYLRYKDILQKLFSQSKVVCVFSSAAAWTRDRLYPDVLKDVVRSVSSTFLDKKTS